VAASPARTERLALCRLLTEVGPDAPTLCAGWDTHDLAAHLVLRERRPDTAPGLLLGPLAGYTERVRHRTKQDTPFDRLIELIAAGPPRWSPWALPGLDATGNLTEFFVHHEDVRRAGNGQNARELEPDVQRALWNRLQMARLVLRGAPVGVRLRWSDDFRPNGPEVVAKTGASPVTVSGGPAELTLWVFGRTTAAHVTLDGDDTAVARLTAATWSV